MKFNLKTLVAAASMVVAAQANAAIDMANTGNGELFLTAWDSVRNVSYTRELGVNIDAFLPNSQGGSMTPNSGLSLSFAGDALFGSTFTGSSAGNIQWNVVAGDSLYTSGTASTPHNLRIITTSTQASPAGISFTNSALGTAVQKIDNFTQAVNNAGCSTSASCVITDPTAAGFGGNNAGAAGWGSSFGGLGAVSNAGTGFSSLFFYYLTGNNGTGFAQLAKTLYANTLGSATWTLAANGALTYAVPAPAAVPIPAAVWLFVSGLMGLATIARRKQLLPA